MSNEPKTSSGFHDKYGNSIPLELSDNDFAPGPVSESMRPLYEQFRSRVIELFMSSPAS